MADNNRYRNLASNENWDKNQGRYVDDNNYNQHSSDQGYRDLDRDGLVGNTGGFYGGTSYTGSNYNDWNNNQYMNRDSNEYNRSNNDNRPYNDYGRNSYQSGYTQSRYGDVNDNNYQDYRSYGTYSNYNDDRYRGDQQYNRNYNNDRWGTSSYGRYNDDAGYNDYGTYHYGNNRPYYADRGNAAYNNYNDNYGNRNRNWDNDRWRNSGNNSGQDRDWWDRTKDEVASWFGDEDAERRRRRDEQRAGEHKGKGPRQYQRSDERIKEDVSDRLSDDAFIDASDIDVKVENGEVTLSGTVDSRNAKRRAEDIIESVSGVKNVMNNLRVSSAATVGSSTVRSTTNNDYNRS